MREKRREDLGLGPMPEVDMKRVEEVCKLDEGVFAVYLDLIFPLPCISDAHASLLPTLPAQINSRSSLSRRCGLSLASYRP